MLGKRKSSGGEAEKAAGTASKAGPEGRERPRVPASAGTEAPKRVLWHEAPRPSGGGGVTLRRLDGEVLWRERDEDEGTPRRVTAEEVLGAAGLDPFTTRLLCGSRALLRASPVPPPPTRPSACRHLPSCPSTCEGAENGKKSFLLSTRNSQREEDRLELLALVDQMPEEVAGLSPGDTVELECVRYYDFDGPARGEVPRSPAGRRPRGKYHSYAVKKMESGGESWREVAVYIVGVKTLAHPLTAWTYALSVGKV